MASTAGGTIGIFAKIHIVSCAWGMLGGQNTLKKNVCSTFLKQGDLSVHISVRNNFLQ